MLPNQILWKFLCENFGIKTRREAELYITCGKVKLSGEIITSVHLAEKELEPGTLVEVSFSKRVD